MPGNGPAAPSSPRPPTPAYARRDAWERLGQVAERLAAGQHSGQNVGALETELADLMAFLRGVERLWVYPGAQGLATLEDWASREDYDILGEQARIAAWQLGRWSDKASMFGGIGESVRQPDQKEKLPGCFTLLWSATPTPRC